MERHASALIFLSVLAAAAVFAAVFAVPAPAARAAGASLAVSPSTMLVGTGARFTVGIVVNSDVPVNAAQGTVTFPIDKLRVVSVSKSGSIFQFWSQDPTAAGTDGTMAFGGGLPAPGFTGSAGLLFKITFQATGAGVATLDITQGAVLANDGAGTNVLDGIRQGVYTISGTAPQTTAPAEIANEIASKTFPDPNRWYHASSADFSWTLPPSADKVSYVLDQQRSSVPSGSFDPTDHVTVPLADRADGVWYFHLQIHANGAWGSVYTRKIGIDRTPPNAPAIKELSTDPTDPHPVFSWLSADQTSGIQSYRLKIGSGDWFTPSPADATKLTLPAQAPGKYALAVEADDFAGNAASASQEFTVAPIAPPVVTDWPASVTQAPSVSPQVVVIKGRAASGDSVIVSLRRDGDALTLTAPVADDGTWQTSYAGTLAAGTWSLTARAVDARGALSNETDPIFIKVNDLFGNLIRSITAWGAVALVGILVFVLLVFFVLTAAARLRRYRAKLRTDILTAHLDLLKDFEKVEKDLNRSGSASAARERAAKDMDELAKDIHKEMERLKKDAS